MNTSTITLLVIAVLAASAYGLYLVTVIKGDGLNFTRRQPPESHRPDLFDPTAGTSGPA